MQDKDGDGIPGVYAVDRSTTWTVDTDGTPGYELRKTDCFVAGDPDDDGMERAPPVLLLPGAEFCTANAGSAFELEDRDKDGIPAVYAHQRTTVWQTAEDGSAGYKIAHGDCWAGGDPDESWSTVRASAGSSPGQPFVNAPIRLSYEKSVNALDSIEGGAVGVSVDGPASKNLAVQTYDVDPARGPYKMALDWTWVPTEPGAYRVSFSDESTMGRSKSFMLDITVGPVALGVNEGETFYGFGDSISVATEPGQPANGSESYVFEVARLLNASAEADHNMDGRGRASWWGASHLQDHLAPSIRPNGLFMVAFGQNDRRWDRGNLTANETVAYLDEIVQGVTSSTAHTIVVMPLIMDPSHPTWYADIATQHEWLIDLETALAARGIPFVRAYDALDSSPGNGVPDGWIGQNYLDAVHPDAEGHGLLGAYIAGDIGARGWYP